MDFLKVLQDMIANIAALQLALQDAEATLALAKQASYDEGYAAGVASVPVIDPPPTSDKIYSQAELDAAVATAVTVVQAKVDELQAQVDTFPGIIDAKVAEAMAAFKADLFAKYKDLEVVMQAAETGFEELLK